MYYCTIDPVLKDALIYVNNIISYMFYQNCNLLLYLKQHLVKKYQILFETAEHFIQNCPQGSIDKHFRHRYFNYTSLPNIFRLQAASYFPS